MPHGMVSPLLPVKSGLEIAMETGDICLAVFPFIENSEKKARPALVWELTPVSATLVFISSKKVCSPLTTEVVIKEKDADAIGLSMDSRIDFGKRAKVPLQDVKKKIGELSSLRPSKMRECFFAAKSAGLLD
jgi:hypothetical protein